MKRALQVGVLICCALLMAGFGQQGAEFGRLGARGKAKAGGGGGACTNRLDFSNACNSQYITMGPLR